MAETKLQDRASDIWPALTDQAKRAFIQELKTVPQADLKRISQGLNTAVHPELPPPDPNTDRRALELMAISDFMRRKAVLCDNTPIIDVKIIGQALTLSHKSGAKDIINLGPKGVAAPAAAQAVPANLPPAKPAAQLYRVYQTAADSEPAAPADPNGRSIDKLANQPGALFLNDNQIAEIVDSFRPSAKKTNGQ